MIGPQAEQRALSGVWADAHAKINLFLHITGRRDDGYHLIQSIFAFAGLGDRLFARPAETFSMAIAGPMADHLQNGRDSEADDLVIKAARPLKDWAEANDIAVSGAHFELDKQIPVSAGLGGGSADAAATLRAMKMLWKLPIEDDALGKVAEHIGADVPACLSSRLQWVEGIGERCLALSSMQQPFCVLLNCGKPVDTGKVFARFAATGTPFSDPLDRTAISDPLDIAWLSQNTRNDLQSHAIAECPDIAEALEALRTQPECQLARMSGSGPTCFALFPTGEMAEAARSAIAENYPNWWLWSGSLIKLKS